MTWLSKFARLKTAKVDGFHKEKKTIIIIKQNGEQKLPTSHHHCNPCKNTITQSIKTGPLQCFAQCGVLLSLCEGLRMEEGSVLMLLTLLDTHQAALQEVPLNKFLLIHSHLSVHLIGNCVKYTQQGVLYARWNMFSLDV